jgi:hypothetical protein
MHEHLVDCAHVYPTYQSVYLYTKLVSIYHATMPLIRNADLAATRHSSTGTSFLLMHTAYLHEGPAMLKAVSRHNYRSDSRVNR